MNICVYAASSGEVDKKYLNAADAFGRTLAGHSHSLVFGGGATGLMGALARAVSDEGGVITGVAPHFFNEEGVLYENCTELVFTNTIRERKQIMEDISSAFVALPGGIGTLEEFFEILTLKQLGQHKKPIAVLNVDGYYDDLNRLVEKAEDERFLKRGRIPLYRSFSEAEELIGWIDGCKR